MKTMTMSLGMFLDKLTPALRSYIAVNEIINGPEDRISLTAYKAVLTESYSIPEIDYIITKHPPGCFDKYGFHSEIFSVTLFGDERLDELKDSMAHFFVDNYFSNIKFEEFNNDKRGGFIYECVCDETRKSVAVAMSWLFITPEDLDRFKDDPHFSKITQGGHLLTCTVLWENEDDD